MMEQINNKRLIEAIKEKAKELLPVGSRVVLFGSRARNEARQDSDWDLHILIPGERELKFNEWSALSIEFDDLGEDFNEIVSTLVYSTFGWEKRKITMFYKNVENDKKIIYQS